MAKPCHICKNEGQTSKYEVLIELNHPVDVPLTMTVPVCDSCVDTLATVGIGRPRSRLVIRD